MLVIAAGVALGIIAAVLFFAFLPAILRAGAILVLATVGFAGMIAFIIFGANTVRSSGLTGADFTVIIAIISASATLAALAGYFDNVKILQPNKPTRGGLIGAVLFHGVCMTFWAVLICTSYPDPSCAIFVAFAGLSATPAAVAVRALRLARYEKDAPRFAPWPRGSWTIPAVALVGVAALPIVLWLAAR
jgi:hypothetical protein